LPKSAKPFGSNEIWSGRAKDQLADHIVRFNEDQNGTNDDRDDRSNDMPAKLLEMIYKGHLAGRAIISSGKKLE
jgi:hypothetical protein